MKNIKLLFSVLMVLSIFSITGCELNEGDSSTQSTSTQSSSNDNNTTNDEVLPANDGSGDIYIIQDGSNIINNQRIEKSSSKPGK